MSEEKNIRFIRKGGRIIPIRKDHQKAAEGGALLAAGGAFSALAATLAGKTYKSGVSKLQLAMDFGSRSPEYLIPGAKIFKKGENLKKYATKAKGPIKLIGAGLVGVGVEKLMEASGIEQKTFAPEFASEITGIAASELVYAGFKKGADDVPMYKTLARSAVNNKGKLVSALKKMAKIRF